MEDVLTTEYDGCGRCLVAVRRLSRKTDKTSSPQRQGDQNLRAAADAGGHIIAWADDWEVSGATDPVTRKGLGPWLRGEMGPYDGIVAPTVDRVGRNVRDTLNTQTLLTSQDRVVVTADHAGVWDFSDPNQENEWLVKAWGSQMELRAIQKRNRDEAIRARKAGEPKQRPSYGYMYVPGLLQTRSYASAVIRTCRPYDPEEKLEQDAAARVERQNILTRDDPPKLWVVLGEGVLRQAVGGIRVMREQLDHLLSLAEAQGIVLQVLPFAVSDAPGVDGPAALFEFDDAAPVAYLEGWGSGRVVKDPREVTAIATALSMIKGCALSPIDSAQLMTEIRSEL